MSTETSTGFRPIGESVAIELANTVQTAGDDVEELIPTPESLAEWADVVDLEPAQKMSRMDENHLDILELRRAIRAALVAMAEGVRPAAQDIGVIDDAASLAEVSRRIALRGDEIMSWYEHYGTPSEVAISHLANHAIDLLTGPETIAVCASPGCSNLFVQEHGRRRYCESACGARARQKRYRKGN